MVKKTLWLLILSMLLLAFSVFAIPPCSNNQSAADIPCAAITTPIANCSDYNYSIVYQGVLIENNNLGSIGGEFYTFNFSYSDLGNYFILLCNGDNTWLEVHEASLPSGGVYLFPKESTTCTWKETQWVMIGAVVLLSLFFIIFNLFFSNVILGLISIVGSFACMLMGFFTFSCFLWVGVLLIIIFFFLFLLSIFRTFWGIT